MSNPYGPWATLIDAGRNPQLSAFWRRRLTMLVPASRTSPTLSRRHLLGLVAAAALICALPTLHAAPAAAQQQKPAAASPPSAPGGGAVLSGGSTTSNGDVITVDVINMVEGPAAGSPSTTSSSTTSKGAPLTVNRVITYTPNGPILPEQSVTTSEPMDLSFPFYQPLLSPRARKELHLSAEQERKLHELDRKFQPEFAAKEEKAFTGFIKAVANLPVEEQYRKQEELLSKLRPEIRPARLQVEALLTPEQLAKLRTLTLIDHLPVLLYASYAVGHLTKEQEADRQRLSGLDCQFMSEASEKAARADRENDEKALAILTPAQREQLERQIREGEYGMPIIFGQQLYFQAPSPPLAGWVSYPPLLELRKELALSDLQMDELHAIESSSRPSHELYKLYLQPADVQPQPGRSGAKGGAGNANGAVVAAPSKQSQELKKTGAGKPAPAGLDSYWDGTTISGGTLSLDVPRPDAEITVVKVTQVSSATLSLDAPRLPPPELWQRMKQPEFRRQVEDLKKQLRQQIEAVLTPAQLDTLRKLALQQAMARRARDPDIPADLHPTEQQKKEMYRLFAAKAETWPRLYREARERLLGALSPAERQKFFDAMDRQEWWGH